MSNENGPYKKDEMSSFLKGPSWNKLTEIVCVSDERVSDLNIAFREGHNSRDPQFSSLKSENAARKEVGE